jgi:hypothetical protein
MKQTAVDWFSNQAYDLFEQYSEGKFDRITLNKLMLEATVKAKAMEKERIGRAYQEGLIDGMNHTPKDYYNETYGGESKT